jgi:hypothetical protein
LIEALPADQAAPLWQMVQAQAAKALTAKQQSFDPSAQLYQQIAIGLS